VSVLVVKHVSIGPLYVGEVVGLNVGAGVGVISTYSVSIISVACAVMIADLSIANNSSVKTPFSIAFICTLATRDPSAAAVSMLLFMVLIAAGSGSLDLTWNVMPVPDSSRREELVFSTPSTCVTFTFFDSNPSESATPSSTDKINILSCAWAIVTGHVMPT